MTIVESIEKIANKPGAVVIDEILLRSYNGFVMDLKGVFQNFVIYEDIFSNFMSGSLTIIDSLNLVKNFPIIGAEVLTVSYRTPIYGASPRKLVFRTFKISLIAETAQETAQLVRIEFVSHNAIKNMQTKVSKSFSGMPISKMVENIYDEYLAKDRSEDMGSLNSSIDTGIMSSNLTTAQGNLQTSLTLERVSGSDIPRDTNSPEKYPITTIVETFDKRSYVIPYFSPFEAINWLCSRARATSNTTMCDYVFFENSKGHHFVPLSYLKQMPAKCTYTKIPKGIRSENDNRALEFEMRNVLSASINDMTDKIKEQVGGMLASSMITHDMTTKTWNSFQYRYDPQFKSSGAHLEKNPLIPEYKVDYTAAVEACTQVLPKTTYTMPGIVSNNDPEEISLLRRSLLLQTTAINITLECWGDTNMRVGNVIEYSPISKESTKKLDSYEDDYLKGRYLVTAIRHQVTDREHRMTMTISKDSFAEPLASKKKETLKET